MPDASQLLQIIAGVPVFGLDVDSRIRQASNCMSARLMVELFRRCDDSQPDWQVRFAKSLSEHLTEDPSILVGLDDGRWQEKEVGDENDLSPVPEASFTYYLKLTFRTEEASRWTSRSFRVARGNGKACFSMCRSICRALTISSCSLKGFERIPI